MTTSAKTLAEKALQARATLRSFPADMQTALAFLNAARIAAGAADKDNTGYPLRLAEQMDAIKLQVMTGNVDLAITRLANIAEQAETLS